MHLARALQLVWHERIDYNLFRERRGRCGTVIFVRFRTRTVRSRTMSVMEFRKNEHEESAAVSGGAMDKVVVRKKVDKRVLIAGAGGLALILIIAFWLFAPRAGSQSVAMDRLTIAPVEKGVFEDFLPLRA